MHIPLIQQMRAFSNERTKWDSDIEQVEYGLDTVATERAVDVPLRDLLYVRQTLGELIRFFHQPLHFPDLEAVERFMGNKEAGAFHLLCECYYQKLYDVWPTDIKEGIDEGRFDNPTSPYYYKSADPGTDG